MLCFTFCGSVQELCSPLVDVLVTMQLDTGILIANYKQACFSHALTVGVTLTLQAASQGLGTTQTCWLESLPAHAFSFHCSHSMGLSAFVL